MRRILVPDVKIDELNSQKGELFICGTGHPSANRLALAVADKSVYVDKETLWLYQKNRVWERRSLDGAVYNSISHIDVNVAWEGTSSTPDTSLALWAIKKYIFNGEYCEVLWAGGTKAYDKVWDLFSEYIYT